MSIAGKELCGNCNVKKAVWYYMPGFSSGRNPHFCDDCVPRGCECNHYSTRAEDYSPPGDIRWDDGIIPGEDDQPVKWVTETIWTHVDMKGREYPCCEYMYDDDGFEIENYEQQ